MTSARHATGQPGRTTTCPIHRAVESAVTDLKRIDVAIQHQRRPRGEPDAHRGRDIVDLDFSVVADRRPSLYLTVREPEEAVKAVARAPCARSWQVGLQAILTSGRGKVQIQAADLMQKTLDRWGAGVTVVEVQIRSANPPTRCRRLPPGANAGQTPRARSTKPTLTRTGWSTSQGRRRQADHRPSLREQAVREALGETARFNQILRQYKRAPGGPASGCISRHAAGLSKSNKVVWTARDQRPDHPAPRRVQPRGRRPVRPRRATTAEPRAATRPHRSPK